MRLILLTVVAATVVGLIAGGTFRDFPSAKLRWWGLALAGAVLQFIPSRGATAMVLLLASFAALIAFAIVNVHAPGFGLILAGLALNALVIAVNQGMPVTRHALVASNQTATLDDLIHNGGAKHHLADGGTSLEPLGDVIPLGAPIDQTISIGDTCVQLGTAWFIVFAMPRRHPKIAEPETAAT
ncbi:MAG: DUF5317 family protein [Actinomycetota bacterium]